MRLALRPLTIALLGVALLAVSRPTSAGYSIETVTANFGPSTAPTTETTSAFQLFNSNQGTLISVTLVLTQTATVSSSVVNQNANPQTSSQYSVYSYDSVIATGLDGKQVGSSVISNTVMGSISGGSMLSNLGAVSNTQASSHAVNAIDITKYIGSGTSTLSVYSFTTAVGSNLGNSNPSDPTDYLKFGALASYYGTVQITYQYSAVPEPASLGMAAIGLGAVAFASRFRHRNKQRVA